MDVQWNILLLRRNKARLLNNVSQDITVGLKKNIANLQKAKSYVFKDKGEELYRVDEDK